MEADADAKKEAEEADNESTDESTDQDEKKDVESLNNREGDKPFGKKRVERSTNKKQRQQRPRQRAVNGKAH